MIAWDKRERIRRLRTNRRGGLSPPLAVMSLAAVVVAVAVAGFVGLGAATHASTHTVKTCAPAGTPQCESEKSLVKTVPDDIILVSGG